MTENSVDQQVLQYILENLVSKPEKIQVTRKVDEMGVLLSVQVGQEDMGILIGRGGIMANSIKTICKAVGRSNDMNVRVQFLEPDGSVRERPERKDDRRDSKPKEEKEEVKMTDTEVKEKSSDLDNDIAEFIIE